VYFLYKILVVSLPVGKAHISYSMEVTENKKNEIGKIVKKTGLDDLKELKDSIESLSWVESVDLNRNILSKLKILVAPRVPVARVNGAGGNVIDKKGFIFNADNVGSLPIVELDEGVSSQEIIQAIRIFKIVSSFTIDKIVINSKGIRTKCSDFEVIWGSDEFERKYDILKCLLGDNTSEFKGKFDFRFKNMVVLRR
jgi:hypothetical protein